MKFFCSTFTTFGMYQCSTKILLVHATFNLTSESDSAWSKTYIRTPRPSPSYIRMQKNKGGSLIEVRPVKSDCPYYRGSTSRKNFIVLFFDGDSNGMVFRVGEKKFSELNCPQKIGYVQVRNGLIRGGRPPYRKIFNTFHLYKFIVHSQLYEEKQKKNVHENFSRKFRNKVLRSFQKKVCGVSPL